MSRCDTWHLHTQSPRQVVAVVDAPVGGDHEPPGRIRERLALADLLGGGPEVAVPDRRGAGDGSALAVGAAVREAREHPPHGRLVGRRAVATEDDRKPAHRLTVARGNGPIRGAPRGGNPRMPAT